MPHRLNNALFTSRTLKLIKFDLKRALARLRRYPERGRAPQFDKLHIGCGPRRVAGWLNVDVSDSDYNVDLITGRLPWRDDVFAAVVSQHFVEHVELKEELLPLLRELRRVLKAGGEIWLSCPDIEKACRSYLEHRMVDLIEERRTRWTSYSLGDIPSGHMINDLFHQDGEHKNLFDFDILNWALTTSGFTNVRKVIERDLLARFPEFPPRHDDAQTLYVSAVVPPQAEA
jgi:predicted SAM-dependent methyltransferase